MATCQSRRFFVLLSSFFLFSLCIPVESAEKYDENEEVKTIFILFTVLESLEMRCSCKNKLADVSLTLYLSFSSGKVVREQGWTLP